MCNKYFKGYVKYCCCLLVAALIFSVQPVLSQQKTDSEGVNVRLNQIGFYPAGPKIGIVLNSKGDDFYIRTTARKNVFAGKLKKSVKPTFGGAYTGVADFSEFKTAGKYLLYVPGSGYSYPFEIKASVHHNVAAASIKAYYFMRSSIALKEKYAGKWSRAAGHPDTIVLIHASAVSDGRPAGTIISSPRGWYDAGDYNKYIVNSGITTSTLLSLYEDFPAYMKTVKLTIPESGNGLPDVLNEVLWNLRWMFTMQDPADGGVYHKLTNAAFDKMEMPDKSTEPRYVVQKGTAATLDFAAVMAQASRVFGKFKTQLPGLADSCLVQANKAWEWAVKNPNVAYNQDAMNRQFEPKVTTGAYGDRNFKDEFIWAASELTVATLKPGFLKDINLLPDTTMPVPTWSQVKLLGYYTLVKNSSALGANASKELPEIEKRLLAAADNMIAGADETAYQTVMNKSARHFGWAATRKRQTKGFC